MTARSLHVHPQPETLLAARVPNLSIRSAQIELQRLRLARDELRSLGLRLADEFSARQPRAPVYLVRSPDRANTFLRWRYRKLYDRKRCELSTIETQATLRELPATLRGDILATEYWRVRLNYTLSTQTYVLTRLQGFLDLEQSRLHLCSAFHDANLTDVRPASRSSQA